MQQDCAGQVVSQKRKYNLNTHVIFTVFFVEHHNWWCLRGRDCAVGALRLTRTLQVSQRASQTPPSQKRTTQPNGQR